MKKLLLLCLGLSLGATIPYPVRAQSPDTVTVQTFTFADPSPQGFSAPYRGTFQFPDTSEEYAKILMYYTLKCDAKTNQDSYPCGEWDYLTYTFVVDSSGWFDSTRRSNPNYATISGASPDSVSLQFSPSWEYRQEWHPYITYLDTSSLSLATVGQGNIPLASPLALDQLSGRAQYLWRATELSNAGLTAGNISGLRVKIEQLGDEIRNLRIRIKPVNQSVLTSIAFETGGFTEVYLHHTQFATTGWQSLAFPQPFVWDGNSDLLVEWRFDQSGPGLPHALAGDSLADPIGRYSAENQPLPAI